MYTSLCTDTLVNGAQQQANLLVVPQFQFVADGGGDLNSTLNTNIASEVGVDTEWVNTDVETLASKRVVKRLITVVIAPKHFTKQLIAKGILNTKVNTKFL